MLSKLLLAIRFHNCFGDEPITQREEVFSGQERETLPVKVNSAVWPGHLNFEEYVEEDQEGNLSLKTVDENQSAQLVLSKNGFSFTVSYLFMLPNKKPQWQELSQSNLKDSTLRNILNHSVASGSSKAPNEKRLRMVYEYVRLTQIHSVNRFPQRWCYPLSLLLMYKLRSGIELAKQP